MRYELDRNNSYNNHKVRVQKKKKSKLKNIIIASAMGSIVIFAANIFGISKAEAGDKVNNDINIESSITDEGIDFKNVDYEVENEDLSVEEIESSISNPLNAGSDENKSKVIDFLYGPVGQYIYKYSEEYGVDPNIIASMAMQETSLSHNACIPGGEMYSGYGVGLLQLESPSGEEISAYNYKTGQMDTEYITMDNACDIVKNIKIGCMIFQNSLKNNNGNILLAIQAHNYGQPMIDMILDRNFGDSIDEVKKDYSNISWLPYIKEAHDNPSLYIYDWQESGYGDGNYIENVLRFCPDSKIKYKYDDCEYTMDLNNLKVTDSYSNNDMLKK